MTTLDDILNKMDPETRAWVEKRGAELIREEATLQEIRRLRKLTQAQVAKQLNVTQDSVSRYEKRSDLLFSTLRNMVRAMGGDLELVAHFPGQGDTRVILPLPLSELDEKRSASEPRRRTNGKKREDLKLRTAQRRGRPAKQKLLARTAAP